MEYCKTCVYPRNARPTIVFDERGVCSGCNYHEARTKIDWRPRQELLKQLLKEEQARAAERAQYYDCIVPVSGGKDSHYQVWLLTQVYHMRPLLVWYNHGFNSALGLRNLRNLVAKSGCDIVSYGTNWQTARRLSRYAIRKVGDLTWHYHAGIMCYPLRAAVQYKIPLIVWGEAGFSSLVGTVDEADMAEYSAARSVKYCQRGLEPDTILRDDLAVEEGVTEYDVAAFRYPTQEELDAVAVRGVYLSNYEGWDALEHTKTVVREWEFAPYKEGRENTFDLFSKTDDHANPIHKHMQWLKFGYELATDHGSREVRAGRMTREKAIQMVRKYEGKRPGILPKYLNWLGMDYQDIVDYLELMRDPAIWAKSKNGEWAKTDSVQEHEKDAGVQDARLRLVRHDDQTFGVNNMRFFSSYKGPAYRHDAWCQQL